MMEFRKVFSSFLCFVFLCGITATTNAATTDVTAQWDSAKVCKNPDKGWYQHYWDNGIDHYLLPKGYDLDSFPGMNHIYVRLAWSYFEPTEGHYDWHWIDSLYNVWGPKGYNIGVRISCKESDLTYATPQWVVQAGAKGSFVDIWGTQIWVPDYGDPIFLAKLTAFHQAFANRYDGRPWLLYVDVGSIGTWGEGHEYPAGTAATAATKLKHIDMYVSCYKKTLIVGVDDFAWNSPDEWGLRQYIESKGLTWRDDSPLVGYYVTNFPSTFSVSNPQYYSDVYKKYPTILETEHYSLIKRDGNWVGQDGSTKGASILRGALGLMHATYIGFHGAIDVYQRENPNIIKELANKCGYWYFVKSVTLPDTLKAGTSSMTIKWENHGVAPAYKKYKLELKLVGAETRTLVLTESDNRKWADGASYSETYSISLPFTVKTGTYSVNVRLKDTLSTRNVELALKNSLRDTAGFYKITNVYILGQSTGKSSDEFRKNLIENANHFSVSARNGQIFISGIPDGHAYAIDVFDFRGTLKQTAIAEAGFHSLLVDKVKGGNQILANGEYVARLRFGSKIVYKMFQVFE